MIENIYKRLSEFCLTQLGTTTDYKEEWRATRYMVGGKMFAMFTNDGTGKPIITLKLEPALGALMRQQYEHIVPGYYMNKEHWNSVYLEGNVPNDVIQTMLKESHRLIIESLSKKIQKELGWLVG